MTPALNPPEESSKAETRSLSAFQPLQGSTREIKTGAGEGSRTPDLRITSALLYH